MKLKVPNKRHVTCVTQNRAADNTVLRSNELCEGLAKQRRGELRSLQKQSEPFLRICGSALLQIINGHNSSPF